MSAPRKPSTCCTGCGGPRNHFVDGAMQAKCAKCNDLAAVLKPSRATVRDSPLPQPGIEARALLIQIGNLLDDDRYEFAAETLEGIRQTVLKTGRATERQELAVQNIEDGGSTWHEAIQGYPYD